jgi:hypothetical protein
MGEDPFINNISVLTEGRQRTKKMKMEDWIRAIAGTFILLSLILAQVHSPYWLLFTAFVGLNLLQSAFTKWCLMEKILAGLGVQRREG